MSAADLVDYGFQSFDDLSLKPELLRGISAYGLRNPSKIHQHGVVPIIRGRDCILLAPPGIRRMTTLCIGVLQRVDMSVGGPQAILLANNDGDAREFRRIIDALCLVDENSATKLRAARVLIGTERLVRDMISQQAVNSDDIKIYCVDDGEKVFSRRPAGQHDESLSHALQTLHSWLPNDIQIIIALSTMTDDVVGVTRQIMSHPMTIAVHDDEAQDEV